MVAFRKQVGGGNFLEFKIIIVILMALLLVLLCHALALYPQTILFPKPQFTYLQIELYLSGCGG